MATPVALVPGKSYITQAGYIGERLAVVAGVNLQTVGTTLIYTVPAGVTALFTMAFVEITAATAITVGATGGLGIAAGEADVFAPVVFTGVLAAGQVWAFQSAGLTRTGPAASVVRYGNDVAATGTSQTARIHLFGFLF